MVASDLGRAGLRHPRTQLSDRLFPVHILGTPSMLDVGGPAPLAVLLVSQQAFDSSRASSGSCEGRMPSREGHP